MKDLVTVDIDYAIALQRAIEHHCKGKVVPDEIARECPHHAEMLNKHLAAQPTLAGGQAVCSLPGCLNEVYKSGLCVDHYEPPAAKA